MILLNMDYEAEIKCFSDNKMIACRDRFKSIILTKSKSQKILTEFSIITGIISKEKYLGILRIHPDSRLKFNLHIKTIFKSKPKLLRIY